MADRKYDRRFDIGSALPLRASANEPTRSMGSLGVPVLMKSSSSRSLVEEESEKRRRETMSHQLRVPSLPSKSMLLGALGVSKSATLSDLPTITGKKPLPKALLPKEARKNSYQPVISGPFAFTTGLSSVKTWPAAYSMQRRSSISSCYPLRPSTSRSERVPNGTDTERRSTESRLQDDALRQLSLDRARRNSVNTLSPPPIDASISQASLFRDREGSAVGRQDVDTDSIYPMLRNALGKDVNDDYSVIRRNHPARQNTEKKERPVSYADPHSFLKMHEDMQTAYVEHPPSYDPPPALTKTSLETDAAVISKSYSVDKAPDLQGTYFANTSDSMPVPDSTRKPVTTASVDQTCDVPYLLEDIKPRSHPGRNMKFETFPPNSTGQKLQTPRLDEISPNAREPKIPSPVAVKMETMSFKTTKPPIQNPAAPKPEAISINKAEPNRQEWYSAIPVTPRRVIKSPRLSSGSLAKAEILSPAYSGQSSKSTDSPFENTQKARSAFSFEIETSSLSPKYSAMHNDSRADMNRRETGQNFITKENNSPPALPSNAPPPLPVTLPPTGAPICSPHELHHIQEYSCGSHAIPENCLDNKPVDDSTTVEIAPPALPSNAPPPLPVASPPAFTPIIPLSEPPRKDLEYNSSSEIPEDSSNKLKGDLTTVETAPPVLPSSAPPPLPGNSPPEGAPTIHTSGPRHEALQHSSSSDTILGNWSNEEAATRSEHGTTTESNIDELEQPDLMGRLHRQSLSSEESLPDGQETKSSGGTARNRETLSPTLSDADSGIDSVKLEQKRNYETGTTNEEYQTDLLDEQSETIGRKSDVAVSPVLCDPNITGTPLTDVPSSDITSASLEPQETGNSDCVGLLPSPDLLPRQIETGPHGSEECVPIKALGFDKGTEESTHQPHERVTDTTSLSEEDKPAKSDDPDPALNPPTQAQMEEDKPAKSDDPDPALNPPTQAQILTAPNELSEKGDTTSVGQRKLTTVSIQKGIMGLGFSLQGGKGSAYGDLPLTVKKIFKAGDASVKEMLTVGDEIFSVNGKDLTSCSLHEAWNYMKKLPDGTLDLVIRKASAI